MAKTKVFVSYDYDHDAQLKPESTEGGRADGVPQAQKGAPVFGDNGF